MFNTFYHLSNHQREVWSLINNFDSFDIKLIPHTENSDSIMLTDEASNSDLNDGSIDVKLDVDTCRHLIPCMEKLK